MICRITSARSFETNTLALGAYRDMFVGSSDLPGWAIIGVVGTRISQVDSAYPGNPGYTLPAQDGRLWAAIRRRPSAATHVRFGCFYPFGF